MTTDPEKDDRWAALWADLGLEPPEGNPVPTTPAAEPELAAEAEPVEPEAAEPEAEEYAGDRRGRRGRRGRGRRDEVEVEAPPAEEPVATEGVAGFFDAAIEEPADEADDSDELSDDDEEIGGNEDAGAGAAMGGEGGEAGEGGKKRKRRRRRRRRKGGDAAQEKETAPAAGPRTQPAAETDEDEVELPTRRESFEADGARLAADEDADELAGFGDWDVPTWEELIASLHRPER
jgi:hypothetical protein